MLLSAVFVFASFIQQLNDVPAKYLIPGPTSDKVIAKVDGVAIKASELESLLWEWRGQEALADLISYQIIKAAAAKDKVLVPDAEVEAALKDQLAQFNPAALNGKTVDQYLLDQGFTKSRLWLRVKTELLLNKMALKDFKPAEYVKVSTILVKTTGPSPKELADASKKADVFYDMLSKGDDWMRVLQLSTQDPRTVESKGLVGWRKLEAFPFEVQQQFAALKAGGITKPKQTSNGFQIFKLEMAGADAKGADRTEMENIHVQSTKPALASKIRSSAKIERFLQNSGGLES